MSPLWVLQDLLVLQANLDPQGSDDLVLEDPLALLDPLDLHLHMDRVCVCVGGEMETSAYVHKNCRPHAYTIYAVSSSAVNIPGPPGPPGPPGSPGYANPVRYLPFSKALYL